MEINLLIRMRLLLIICHQAHIISPLLLVREMTKAHFHPHIEKFQKFLEYQA